MAFNNHVFRQLSDHKALRANLVPESSKGLCSECSKIASLRVNYGEVGRADEADEAAKAAAIAAATAADVRGAGKEPSDGETKGNDDEDQPVRVWWVQTGKGPSGKQNYDYFVGHKCAAVAIGASNTIQKHNLRKSNLHTLEPGGLIVLGRSEGRSKGGTHMARATRMEVCGLNKLYDILPAWNVADKMKPLNEVTCEELLARGVFKNDGPGWHVDEDCTVIIIHVEEWICLDEPLQGIGARPTVYEIPPMGVDLTMVLPSSATYPEMRHKATVLRTGLFESGQIVWTDAETQQIEQEEEKCRERIASITFVQSRFRARIACRRCDELREKKKDEKAPTTPGDTGDALVDGGGT